MSTKIQVYNGGVLAPGTTSYWDGTREADSTFTFVPYGRPVSKLVETAPFFVAHRGGSDDWSEHSLRGYTESVVLGVDALEISVGQTSDGVFFGLHDDTLNRTTPTLPANYLASAHTWAEISALTQTAGSDKLFGPQPYCRLTDILDAYALSHTIFVDPKVIGSAKYSSLLDLMDSYPNAKDHFVGKYFYSGTNWATACHARGYKTWGYYYASDIASGVVPTTQSNWDFLGLEYGDTQANFDLMASYGKPIIAHIAPSLATAQQAISKGAVGVMVSGVRSVMAGYQ